MSKPFAFLLFIVLFGCGSNGLKKNENSIGDSPNEVIAPKETTPVIEKPTLPAGAVTANFMRGETPFYGYVSNIDEKNAATEISFENPTVPTLRIPKSYGAKLSKLRLAEFDRDLLLVTAKLKDTNFNKYFLYIYKDQNWKPVVNGFAIHKSHLPDTLRPILVDPENPNNMLRYYSVFDLSEDTSKRYTWRLLRESIPIENQ